MMKEFQSVWVVIEGDNGVGKDTAADLLAAEGLNRVDHETDLISARENAATACGIERVQRFMAYNSLCGIRALDSVKPSLSVRYWPSTLAAAYADFIIDHDHLCKLAHACGFLLLKPHVLFLLTCNHAKRCERIDVRGPVANSHDDTSIERAQRHRVAMFTMIELVPDMHWNQIDTSELEANEVHSAIRSYIDAM